MTDIVDFKFGFWLKAVFLCLLFSNTLLNPSLKAQQDLERRISFQANGEKISLVLSRLSASENLSFSYNPGESSFNAIVNYRADNKPLATVLREILALSGHGFRLIGNQIVVFSLDAETPLVSSPTARTPQPATPTNQPIDTASQETVLPIRDTIFRIDTLVIRDTIIIEKEVPRTAKPGRPSPLREDLFRFEPDRNDGWSLMPFYKPMLAFNRLQAEAGNEELLRLTQEAESLSWISQSFGVDARFARNNWHITTGIQYTRFANRFNYAYELIEGGFFRTDTSDIYYTIPQTDTLWHYVTDSTWVPESSREFFYSRINRLEYLEIPVFAAFNLYSDANVRFWVNAGIIVGVLTNKDGVAIRDTGEFAGLEFNDIDFSPLVLSYAFSAGMRYRINEWVDASAEIVHRHHLNTILRNYPLQKRISATGLKIGIVYYL